MMSVAADFLGLDICTCVSPGLGRAAASYKAEVRPSPGNHPLTAASVHLVRMN